MKQFGWIKLAVLISAGLFVKHIHIQPLSKGQKGTKKPHPIDVGFECLSFSFPPRFVVSLIPSPALRLRLRIANSLNVNDNK